MYVGSFSPCVYVTLGGPGCGIAREGNSSREGNSQHGAAGEVSGHCRNLKALLRVASSRIMRGEERVPIVIDKIHGALSHASPGVRSKQLPEGNLYYPLEERAQLRRQVRIVRHA